VTERYRILMNATIYDIGFSDDENYLIVAFSTKI
jgi:hypothetical protein